MENTSIIACRRHGGKKGMLIVAAIGNDGTEPYLGTPADMGLVCWRWER